MRAAGEIAKLPAMSQSRESQLQWLHQAVEKTGLSLNALAELARVNPTTLYRFESGDSEKMRPVTINRIAKAAKLEPPEFSGLSEGDARIYSLKDLPTTAAPGPDQPNLFAVKVINDAMAGADLEPGDLLIIDRQHKPETGDIICAQHYDFRAGGAETIIRYFEPPYLVSASTDPEHRRPILIDGEKVQISGVAIRQIRVRNFRGVA